MAIAGEKRGEIQRKPVVYNLFHPEPALLGELYDGVRSRVIGSQVIALGYDASSKISHASGPWIYPCPTVVFHRKGTRTISYRKGEAAGLQTVGDGQVSLIPAGCALNVDYQEPCEGLVIGLAEGMVGAVREEVGGAGGFPLKLGIDDPTLLTLAESFWQTGEASRRFLDALGRVMTLHVIEKHVGEAGGSNPSPGWLRRAIAYARLHLQRGITLEEMADAAGMSRAHFARCFKRETGVSPHDYLVQARAERARELILADPERPLAAVANASGFCDQSHLTAHFRRAFGTTPAAFRKRPHEAPRISHSGPRSMKVLDLD